MPRAPHSGRSRFGVDERLKLDAAFAVGRPIYLALFGVGFSIAMAAFVRLLAST